MGWASSCLGLVSVLLALSPVTHPDNTGSWPELGGKRRDNMTALSNLSPQLRVPMPKRIKLQEGALGWRVRESPRDCVYSQLSSLRWKFADCVWAAGNNY